MAAQFNTTAFLFAAAQDAVSGLRRSEDSDRSNALRALLNAQTADERDDVVAQWGVALVRKALRVAALSTKDEEVANVFWALRDMVDEDGFLDDDDTTGDDLVIQAEVDKFNQVLAA